MPRPILATVNGAALEHNLTVARSYAPGSRIWAVVKANAYGHGIRNVYPWLRKTDGFALLDLKEAIELRDLGWEGPILLLEGFFESADLQLVERYNLTVAVQSTEQLRMLETARLSRPVPIQLKLNSGMNRLGFKPAGYRAAWERARGIASVGSIGLMTHFSDADTGKGIRAQLDVFNDAVAGIEGDRTCSNSAATMWHPDAHFEWVRPGVMLYGASPSGSHGDIADTRLRPAMTLSSRLIAVQDLEPGDTVGYGSRFVASERMRIGVVACGYADGYPRHASVGTPVAVDGVLTRVVGTVSMDMLTVDLTRCRDAHVGSRVELWGTTVPVDDVARSSGTIGYELMCAVAARVPFRVV